MRDRLRRRLTLSVSLALLGGSVVALSAATPEAEYTRTIFQRVPAVAVLGLLSGCTLAFALALRDALGGRRPYGAVAVLLVGYFAYFTLPNHAGVVLFGGHASDALVHVGTARSILETGFVPSRDWYPLVHVELAVFGAVTATPIPVAQRVLPPLFGLLFALGLGLLAREFGFSKRAVRLTVVAGLPMAFAEFHGSFHPSMVAYFLFPLFVYAFLNSRAGSTYVALVLGIALSVMHPLASLISILFAILFLISRGALGDATPAVTLLRKKAVALVLLALVWSYWFFSFERTSFAIATKLGLLPDPESAAAGGPGGSGIVGIYLRALDGETPIGVVVEEAMLQYAPMMVYATATAVALVVLVASVVSREGGSGRRVTVVVAISLVGIVPTIPFFVTDLFVANPVRAGRWAVIGAILVIGLAIDRSRTSIGIAGTAVIVLLLVSSVPLGLYAADTENQHLREQTVSGSDWLLSNRDPDVTVRSQSLTGNLNGYLTGPADVSPLNYRLPNQTLERPSRIDVNRSLASEFDCGYVVVREYDRKHYKHLSEARRQGLKRLDETDVDRLNGSPRTHRVFTSGATEIWKGC